MSIERDPSTVSNEEAASALMSLLGGPVGMAESGVRLGDFTQILDADPSSDLSGLRFLASRMHTSTVNPNSESPLGTEEQIIEPHIAQKWLIMTGRMHELPDGELIRTDIFDHLAEAALNIANGDTPGYITDEYYRVTDNPEPLPASFLFELGKRITDRVMGTGDFNSDGN